MVAMDLTEDIYNEFAEDPEALCIPHGRVAEVLRNICLMPLVCKFVPAKYKHESKHTHIRTHTRTYMHALSIILQ